MKLLVLLFSALIFAQENETEPEPEGEPEPQYGKIKIQYILQFCHIFIAKTEDALYLVFNFRVFRNQSLNLYFQECYECDLSEDCAANRTEEHPVVTCSPGHSCTVIKS